MPLRRFAGSVVAAAAWTVLAVTPVQAGTLYLRVAGEEETEGAVFVYHLKEEIPAKYRRWIVELPYGPDGEPLIVPNLPGRVYRLDLPEEGVPIRLELRSGDLDREELRALVREVLEEILGRRPAPRPARLERGAAWE